MTDTEVKSLVRSVITIFAMPFAIESVIPTTTGWSVVVRGGTGGTVRFTVVGEEPDTMRGTIRRLLQAEL
jgi:hypothetical protein